MFLAQIISMVAAGILIDTFGYYIFFYTLGGIVLSYHSFISQKNGSAKN